MMVGSINETAWTNRNRREERGIGNKWTSAVWYAAGQLTASYTHTRLATAYSLQVHILCAKLFYSKQCAEGVLLSTLVSILTCGIICAPAATL